MMITVVDSRKVKFSRERGGGGGGIAEAIINSTRAGGPSFDVDNT